MEALVYTFLLIGTLLVIFFAIFFRETQELLKSKLTLKKAALFKKSAALKNLYFNFLN